MRVPDFVVAVEIDEGDVPHCHEWRLITGGSIRGGMSIAHGFLVDNGYVDELDIAPIARQLGEALCQYVATVFSCGVQLRLTP